MKYTNLLKASNSEAIDAVIENLPVNANGYFLTEAQADAIEASLAANASVVAGIQEQLNTATAERVTAVANLNTANETITAHTATIATNNTRIAELEAKPADITSTSREADDKTETRSYLKADNPANAAADKLLGTPKPASK